MPLFLRYSQLTGWQILNWLRSSMSRLHFCGNLERLYFCSNFFWPSSIYFESGHFHFFWQKTQSQAHLLSSFGRMFLKESFCRKLCLLFLEILTSKQMLQASLPFFFKDFKEKDVEFLTEQIHQKDANKWAIVLQRNMFFPFQLSFWQFPFF